MMPSFQEVLTLISSGMVSIDEILGEIIIVSSAHKRELNASSVPTVCPEREIQLLGFCHKDR